MKLLLHDNGGYAFSLQLAEHLAGLGHQVHYLHGGAMQAVQRSRRQSGHSNLHIDSAQIEAPFDKYNFVKRWAQERQYGARLAAKAAQIRPDVIVSSTSPLDSQQYLLDYAHKNGAKFVFWWQDITGLATKKILSQKNALLGWLVGEYYLAMEHAQLRRSHKVIAIAEEFRAPYRQWRLDESKFHVLPNWAALEEIPLLPRDNPWARQHGLQDKFVFLYSGVLALKHNPALLLALADHFAARPDVRVVVVSQGPGADYLKVNPRPNLRVLPFQPYEEYPQVLASADALVAVLEDHAGGYSVPSKVLTYLCAGKPILLAAPRANQAARLVGEHLVGLVSPPNDPGLFCALAQELSDKPDKCHQFGKNARRHAQNAFNIDKISAQFLEILCS
jgi:colanic acid biosynthesis glycosyl transferase WcaI